MGALEKWRKQKWARIAEPRNVITAADFKASKKKRG